MKAEQENVKEGGLYMEEKEEDDIRKNNRKKKGE